MRLPLDKLLKKRLHVEIALLQDEVVDIFYSIQRNAVLHGGTAIWRCYGGKRFSEDLDFYALVKKDFEEKLKVELGKRGLLLDRFKQTQSTVFSKISGSNAQIRLEIALRNNSAKEIVSYEKCSGSTMDIYSLSAKNLLAEKINAYINRRLVRDLYDIFFLSGQVKDFGSIKKECSLFAKKIVLPVDEKNLKTLVYSGIAPASEEMIKVILMRFSA